MSTQTLIKKIERIEQELINFKKPKQVLGKIYIDQKMLRKAKKAIFDFDIERFITKKDLKLWKK